MVGSRECNNWNRLCIVRRWVGLQQSTENASPDVREDYKYMPTFSLSAAATERSVEENIPRIHASISNREELLEKCSQLGWRTA